MKSSSLKRLLKLLSHKHVLLNSTYGGDAIYSNNASSHVEVSN